MTSWLI